MRTRFVPKLVVVVAAVSSGACGGDDAQQTFPSICGYRGEPHAPGELVGGQDPAALLATYWGNFEGTLSWTNGGDTPFTLSVAPATDTNVYASDCDNPESFYIYTTLGLRTEDGGLAETGGATLDVPFPNADVSPRFVVLSPDVISDWQWHGSVTPHLPSDNASYVQRGLLPEVDWTPGAPRPSSLRLYFYAQVIGTNDIDRVLVASVTFP